jgi:tetratricopeptide (TPR) repeat protein
MVRPGRGKAFPAAVVAVVATVAAAFAGSLANGFVFDDAWYVVGNAHVRSGLSPENLTWAFRKAHLGNWHPLTWISHQVDVGLFGLAPGGHHATSVLIHAAVAGLLLAWLRAVLGRVWPAAGAAALFALHPLRVESVAWVAERKDVLSGLFFVLTLLAWHRHLRTRSILAYLGALLACALGLMSKGMLVTLPAVLLLLDWWPYRRLKPGCLARRFLEKAPFLLLAGAAAVVTYQAQAGAGAVRLVETYPLPVRLANALLSAATYLGKTLVPRHLAAFYPHPGAGISGGLVLLAALLLAVVTAILLLRRGRVPALAAGWLWFLGTLVPVAGLVQIGDQALADRYTYLPSLGFSLALAGWGGGLSLRPSARRLLAGSALVALLVLSLLTGLQTTRWRDDRTLFLHAARVVPDNWLAWTNLGRLAQEEGRRQEARELYLRSLAVHSNPVTHTNLGIILAEGGEAGEAARHYREALRLNPDYPLAHNNLGRLLAAAGDPAEAERHLRRALELDPDFAQAHNNLAALLMRTGRSEEAREHYRRGMRSP